ncbi:MAG: hypothetical protein LBV72_15745 [Tannerella sp.]|jgi:hypothetical protein|nr:hypothetical protein [Tannerella sp.]
MDHIKWIFSGIGVLFLSLLIGFIVKHRQNKKDKKTSEESETKQIRRKVNQYGDKSIYVEKNEGDITID